MMENFAKNFFCQDAFAFSMHPMFIIHREKEIKSSTETILVINRNTNRRIHL